jgi:hypothetical protein
MKYFAVVLFMVLHNNLFSQTISIRRSSVSDECTMGYLYVNNENIGYTLERQNKIIPAGSYDAFIRNDGHLRWRIELVNVPPSRENIQIHIGNYPHQSLGCILLGSDANPKNCTISGSSAAMQKLKDAITTLNSDLKIDENASEKYPIVVKYE